MGMVSALLEIGKTLGGDELECAVKMPLASGTEIRVWLDVEDPRKSPLRVRGVARVDLNEMSAKRKRSYLYREPDGSNFSFCYSPVVRMQKKELSFDEAYLEKLGTKVLAEFESPRSPKGGSGKGKKSSAGESVQVFAPGSVARILEGLREHRDELVRQAEAALSEAKRDKKPLSFVLVFGVKDNIYGKETFLYPGDPPVEPLFSSYFWSKVRESRLKKAGALCALCGKEEKHAGNLDEIFAFATFDKKSFLPGGQDRPEKVFPLCGECLRWLFRGRDHADTVFREDHLVRPLHVTVVPELFGVGPGMRFRRLEAKTKNFLGTGLVNAGFAFEELLDRDDVLVYHFLFWEEAQAQERIHLLVEDVPPLRLQRLFGAWRRSCEMFFGAGNTSGKERTIGKEQHLSSGLRFLFVVLSDFTGKSRQDQTALRDMALSLAGKLLSGERVDPAPLKGLFCPRLPGILTDPDMPTWKKCSILRRAERLVDFLARADEARCGGAGGTNGEEGNCMMLEEEGVATNGETGLGTSGTGDAAGSRKFLRERIEEMMEAFADPYLQQPFGRGVFLAGVLLGVFAREQVRGTEPAEQEKKKAVDVAASPLFKQLNFGRLRLRDLKGHLGRLPGLIHQYRIDYAGPVQSFAGEVMCLILEGEQKELGPEGNFAFAAGFLAAPSYFWRCFGKQVPADVVVDESLPGDDAASEEDASGGEGDGE
ncbi:TM1802 family CRISPR-associated protein [Aminiphilus sp.]|uniref:TM1802 family CRISPR-associated protein n=1 Tax=Aminiphilus sp. TaxID=1872488 RepID=UPI00261234BF|nr:TM1802 family CRISPR-associated protein [Aminiphilus sp.]